MKSLAWFIVKFIDGVTRVIIFMTSPVFRWLYDGAQRGLPPVQSDLLMKSGVELAAMIRKRQVRDFFGFFSNLLIVVVVLLNLHSMSCYLWHILTCKLE